MNEIAKFYALIRAVEENEAVKAEAERALEIAYDSLVEICPHSEAVEHSSKIRGVGATRICKICGLVDHASQGGTPGDEYNYGYPGYPDREFWKDSNVEVTDDHAYFHTFAKGHRWRVERGEAVK